MSKLYKYFINLFQKCKIKINHKITIINKTNNFNSKRTFSFSGIKNKTNHSISNITNSNIISNNINSISFKNKKILEKAKDKANNNIEIDKSVSQIILDKNEMKSFNYKSTKIHQNNKIKKVNINLKKNP